MYVHAKPTNCTANAAGRPSSDSPHDVHKPVGESAGNVRGEGMNGEPVGPLG